MSSSVVVALLGFGRTLEDASVETKTKLHVLSTLNEVTLTLNELCESGVGRSVNKLKNAPGELGITARSLVSKWKRLLRTHMVKESMSLPHETDLSNNIQRVTCTDTCSHKSNKEAAATMNVTSAKKVHGDPTILQRSDPSKPINEVQILTRSDSTVETCSPYVNPNVPAKKVKTNDRHELLDIVDSIDSSSGMSFMESLCVGSAQQPRRKRTKHLRTDLVDSTNAPLFSITTEPKVLSDEEILSTISEDFLRPDVVQETIKPNDCRTDFSDDFNSEDGDLKFKSKRVLWVPKANRNGSLFGNLNGSPGSGDVTYNPPKLIDLCLDVIEHNLNRLDHVGHVPYELLARALRHASAEDLARIERCNPQFVGRNDELWQKHVRLNFHGLHNPHPRLNESWCDFYERLSREQASRLNRIINRSARKIREEQESRRTTLTTEVITPRQIQRRLARKQSDTKLSSDSMHFKPYNVSQPSTSRTVNSHHPDKPQRTGNSLTGGGLLNKLRRQFRHGRLR